MTSKEKKEGARKRQDAVNGAINILVQSVELAQSRGAYNLKEADMINNALKVLTTGAKTIEE